MHHTQEGLLKSGYKNYLEKEMAQLIFRANVFCLNCLS